tara:strand:- start:180 stop:311 length:132 start_codon:yes stop_codon:yes gene_type:complete
MIYKDIRPTGAINGARKKQSVIVVNLKIPTINIFVKNKLSPKI